MKNYKKNYKIKTIYYQGLIRQQTNILMIIILFSGHYEVNSRLLTVRHDVMVSVAKTQKKIE